MNLSLETGLPALTVFAQGLLSFFSPCILPLIPLYLAYLSGGVQSREADGTVHYSQKKVFVNTVFFVIGISFTFMLLGFGFSVAGRFFENYQSWFVRFSGILMILFGLYQLGLFGKSKTLEKEHRLPFFLEKWAMNPISALVLGFTFSFAWTPCVGPALTGVLLMVSSAKNQGMGILLMGVYIAGFIIPFLLMGIFTSRVLEFLKRHRGVVKYTVKISACLLVLMGVMTITGWMNSMTGYLSAMGNVKNGQEKTTAVETNPTETSKAETAQKEQQKYPEAPDFTLVDQEGNTHTLSEYKGKTVLLNFWATWCHYCVQEMPDIQKLYEEYGKNTENLVILGVASPKTDQNPKTGEGTVEDVRTFLNENSYTYPVVMDVTGEIFRTYNVQSLPTTYMIDVDGNVFGYVPGMLTEDMLRNIISTTMNEH